MNLRKVGIIALVLNALAHAAQYFYIRQERADARWAQGVGLYAIVDGVLAELVRRGNRRAEWGALFAPLLGGVALGSRLRDAPGSKAINKLILVLDGLALLTFGYLRFGEKEATLQDAGQWSFSMIDKELRMPGRIFNLVARPNEAGLRLLHLGLSRSKGQDMVGKDSRTEWIERSDGAGRIRVRVFRPREAAQPLPIVLYLHGGGYAIGLPEQDGCLRIFEKLMERRPCIVVAPDYRLSFDAPYPAGLNDCYDTLLWAKAQAQALGGRSDQIFVMGDSGGGGLTVAVCLLARERGDVNVAFQMPLYPMIDDRQSNPSAVNNSMPIWNSKFNKVAWRLYLRDLVAQGQEIPATAAPARAADYAGLPPAATFVGDLDPFRDETIRFVERLKADGVPVRFRLFEGCYHGFDQVAPSATVSRAALQFMLDAYADAVDSYFAAQERA